MRIKVFFTGGTIGSIKNDSVISVNSAVAPRIIELYRKSSGDNETEFDCEMLFSVHSENLEFPHIKRIYEAAKNLTKSDCDGVIITHGTDTLAYTTNFLSFLLFPYKLPIFLVSSNKPIDEKYANGIRNFTQAVKNLNKNGVYVALDKVYGGTEIIEPLPFLHSFTSVRRENIIYMPVERFPDRKNIIFLKTYPGLDYSLFDFKQKPDAVLIETYHSGTAKTVSGDGTQNILDFAKRMEAAGVPVYAAPFDSRLGFYESSAAMKEAGIRFLPDITAVSAFVKLQIAYGSFDDESERQLFLFGI
jgi:L-asparaginase